MKLPSKAMIIYIIIIIALAILFSIKEKPQIDNFEVIQEDNEDNSDLIKELYIEELINGEEIFNSINESNSLVYDEFESLAINLKTEIDIISNEILEGILDDSIMSNEEIDEYYNNIHQNKMELLFDNFLEYGIDNQILKKELENQLSNKITSYIETSLSEEPISTNDIEGFQNILDTLDDNLESKMQETNKKIKNLDIKKKLYYFLDKIETTDIDQKNAIKKTIIEEMKNKSILKTEKFSSYGNTMFNGKNNQYDGLINEDLKDLFNNNSSSSDETVFIDPLKAIGRLQDDVVGLLENIGSNNKMGNKMQNKAKNGLTDSTNRGSYLNSLENEEILFRDNLLEDKLSNLFFSKGKKENPKILKKDFETRKILKDKESDIAEIKSRSDIFKEEKKNEDVVEGFESKKKNNNTAKVADGFIKYSSKSLMKLLNIDYNNLFNNLDNETMISYGVILIILALFLFFLM